MSQTTIANCSNNLIIVGESKPRSRIVSAVTACTFTINDAGNMRLISGFNGRAVGSSVEHGIHVVLTAVQNDQKTNETYRDNLDIHDVKIG